MGFSAAILKEPSHVVRGSLFPCKKEWPEQRLWGGKAWYGPGRGGGGREATLAGMQRWGRVPDRTAEVPKGQIRKA